MKEELIKTPLAFLTQIEDALSGKLTHDEESKLHKIGRDILNRRAVPGIDKLTFFVSKTEHQWLRNTYEQIKDMPF